MNIKKSALFCSCVFTVINSGILLIPYSYAEELNTKIPDQTEGILNVKVTINMPAQPLAAALKSLSKQTGLNITFNDGLVSGINTSAITGMMSRKEALQRLLSNTSLEAKLDGNTVYIQRAKQKTEDTSLKLPEVAVRAQRFYEIGPLPGLGLTLDEIPGNVQTLSAKDIKESHSLSITDLMNKKLQSVNVNDYQGNPFMMDVTYRGFTAGPQIGTPQGLSVFFDGIRVNEPFGDVVNWDMIPMNALSGVDVFPGSNPIFGLNTLGGAFTMKTKDGFSNHGLDAEVLTGSFGRKQLQIEGGVNNGTVAFFGAGNFFLEDDFRKNSPSKVNQFFGKASYRGDKLDLNFSTLLAKTDLVGNGLLPSEEYAMDPTSVFTAPDTTKNKLVQFQISGAFQVNDEFSVTGQVYRRKSDRHAIGADVFTDYDEDLLARRAVKKDPVTGELEQFTCLLDSHNANGLPDYYVLSMDASQSTDVFSANFVLNSLGNGFVGNPADLPTYIDPDGNQIGGFNAKLTPEFAQNLKLEFFSDTNFQQANFINRTATGLKTHGDVTSYSNGEFSYQIIGTLFATGAIISNGYPNSVVTVGPLDAVYFYSQDKDSQGNPVVHKNYVYFVTPKNNDKCAAGNNPQTGTIGNGSGGGFAFTYIDPVTGRPATVDGISNGGTGVVAGTPTAILNDNNINQIVNGASIQFNWNLEHHKLMVGGSIDAAEATYTNYSQLGFLDANRNAYLDPAQAADQFAGADQALANNNFSGTNTTKSIYFSETYTPVDTWHFNASGRFNETHTRNTVATRSGFATYGIGDLTNYPDVFAICPNGDCTGIPLNYKLPNFSDVLNPAQTEKFSYYSFNPSFGATWQAKENLNIYGNVARGTRTPSVIELGCAFDRTPTSDTNSTPKSITENRQCTLPTTLSGDPYLPQIKATSYDVGMRGTFNSWLGAENIKWNLGAYETDLRDDIYFVNIGGTQGFFDTIGNTRRRGVEAGLSGRKNKLSFSVNYGLTDATFQDSFQMISNDNSSAKFVSAAGGNYITVNPGDRMPGVPLHNLNASVNYDVTDRWSVGFTAVAHSGSYLRGNENNEHQPGVTRFENITLPGVGSVVVARQPTSNPGSVPGYATFNFQTSYRFNKEWSATLLINNVLDKEYFTAGRLGRNPFSPSILGGIGVDGYNHNSGDWLSTNFIAPAAPRGLWVSLRYEFSPDK